MILGVVDRVRDWHSLWRVSFVLTSEDLRNVFFNLGKKMWQLLNEHVEVDREQIQEQEVESALLVELTSELQRILVRFSKMKEIIIGYDPHEEVPLHILDIY